MRPDPLSRLIFFPGLGRRAERAVDLTYSPSPSAKKPRHDFVWRVEWLGAAEGWVACQAFVAFVLELALVAFPTLPQAVIYL